MSRTIVITGTDTGVGKTVFTMLLVGDLLRRGVNAVALKPVCSGGRDDAEALLGPMENAVTLDEINPWHFRAPLTPSLAARHEGKTLRTKDLVKFVRSFEKRFDVVLVEGAGGLLSPLTSDGSTRELIAALKAEAVLVGRNQLGVINHVRLTLEALPKPARTPVVLMSASSATPASRTNVALLQELLPKHPVSVLPCFKGGRLRDELRKASVRKVLRGIVG